VVKLAELIPWTEFEDAYGKNLKFYTRYEDAFSVRISLFDIS
jgi:hypothetical protein